MSSQLLVWVVLLLVGRYLIYRIVSRRSHSQNNGTIQIVGFQRSMGHKETLKVSSVEDFSTFYQRIAESLGELGFWEAELRIKDSVQSYEVPMAGYYQKMAIITTEILDQNKPELPSPLRRDLEVGYNTCAKLCGIEGYAA
jgi:hypothetical protein